eukprot:COSAG02_NODE_15367_length_1177_cov_1.837662_1_plen_324_part_00
MSGCRRTWGAPRRVVVPVCGATTRRVDVDGAVLLVTDGWLGHGLLWTLAGDTGADLVLAGASRWAFRGALVVVVAAVWDRATRVAVAGVTPDGAAIREPDYAPRHNRTLEPPESRRREARGLRTLYLQARRLTARLAVLPRHLAIFVRHGAPAGRCLHGRALALHVTGDRPVPRRQVLVHSVAWRRVHHLRGTGGAGGEGGQHTHTHARRARRRSAALSSADMIIRTAAIAERREMRSCCMLTDRAVCGCHRHACRERHGAHHGAQLLRRLRCACSTPRRVPPPRARSSRPRCRTHSVSVGHACGACHGVLRRLSRSDLRAVG